MLESFFIHGNLPSHIEKGTYIPLLVLASYVIAAFGSYTGLTLATRLYNAPTLQKKRLLHWAGAFALGSSIWSMHFIGMLAYKMQMTVHYAPGLTFVSMVVAIVAAWFVLEIIRATELYTGRITISAILLGLGICSMHYLGMAAMEMDATIRYIPSLFLVSVAIAIAASGAALWIVFTLGRFQGKGQVIWRIMAALVLGGAICGMHYMGMEAAVIVPFANCHWDPNQSFEMLALAIITITGIISIIGLMLGVSGRVSALIICSIIFALPLVTIVYQAISELDSEIQFARKEQYGVQYHDALLTFLQRMQDLRDITFVARNGGRIIPGQLEARRDSAHHEILIMDNMDRSFGNILNVSQSWQDIRKHCLLLLKMQPALTPQQEFQEHSATIGTMTNLMGAVSDNSNLTLDSALDSSYLADAMINSIPDIIQTSGQIRGLTSGLLAAGKVPRQWGEEEARKQQALYNRLQFLDDAIRRGLERAGRAQEKSRSFIDYHDKVIKPRLDAFMRHLERMAFAHQSDLSLPSMLQMATDIITAYDALNDKAAYALLNLLQQREHGYTVKRNIVFYSSIVASFGFIALFIFLYRALAKTERAEREAIAASHTKSEFLANMSHELRTPLNSILGMMRLLIESGLSREQNELAGTAFQSSVNLLEIVNDILDLSKIEAGEMELEHIGFDPQYVFHSVVDALDHVAREKRVPIIRHYEKEVFPLLLGDPTRFSRVLTNLIGNAIKYTDKGHVDVRAFCTKRDETHIELRCEITDTGIGISKEKYESIFEKFSQADSSTTRRYGGTGLGLAITKQLVKLMGGTIGVESELGEGSTFWFTIPYTITDNIHEDKYIRKMRLFSGIILPADVRILVAEDHPLNQLFIKKIFQKFGIEHFEITKDGLEALQRYQEKPWDIILMDCHMPNKNGYETTKDIRSLEKTTGGHVPIIAMTANAMVGDREKCLRYGMDEYIRKPINVDELKETLSQWINFDELPATTAQAETRIKPNAIDLTHLRTYTEGDIDAEKELIKIFIDHSEKNLSLLEKTSTGTDNSAWSETAHLFKGGAGSVGAKYLSELCQDAQHFTGGTEKRIQLFSRIRDEYDRVKKQLRTMGLLP